MRASVFVPGLTLWMNRPCPLRTVSGTDQDVAVHEAQIEEACLEVDVPFLALHGAMQADPNWLQWMNPMAFISMAPCMPG